MLLVILAPLALAARRLRARRRTGAGRPSCSPARSLHAAGVAALFALAARARAGAWLAFDPLAKRDPPHRHASCSSPRPSTRRATSPAATTATTASSWAGCSVLLARDDRRSALSQHLGLTWVAMEASTLVHRPAHLLQPQRALARGGLEVPPHRLARHRPGAPRDLLPRPLRRRRRAAPQSLLVEDLIAAGAAASRARGCAPPSCSSLVGYGTKMGLAPLHSWKPDAYGEAPGHARRAARRRAHQLRLPVDRARLPGHARPPARGPSRATRWSALGLFSIALAAVFVVGQRDFKRMLAYSSVEHMGILALGVGLGGGAAAGAFFHCINNGLTKGVLFLSAGNIHRAFGSKTHRRRARRGAARSRSPGRCSSPASSPSPARRRSAPSSASSRS